MFDSVHREVWRPTILPQECPHTELVTLLDVQLDPLMNLGRWKVGHHQADGKLAPFV